MDIAAIDSLSPLKAVNGYAGYSAVNGKAGVDRSGGISSFENVFKSALDMVQNTNDLTNAAEEAEMNFALGYSDSATDLLAAQQKANLSLQYTVAVRNAVMSAYREIMNMQF